MIQFAFGSKHIWGDKMYQVFENDKPADLTGYPQMKHTCWSKSKFETLFEALHYAYTWLGKYAPDDIYQFQVGIPYCYNGEDFVVIKMVEP